LARRAIVVTGASKGIGRACTLRLDRFGFRVFAGVRKLADGEALQREGSDQVTPLLLEVTCAASIAAAAERVTAAVAEDGLAGLVNNAGIAVAAPLEFLPVARLREQLEVNVIGQIAVTQAFLPLLRQSHGRVINIGSISGRSASPLLGPYSASKSALESLSDALRLELLPWQICVSIIEAGAVATPLWESSIAAADELTRCLTPQARELYGSLINATRADARNGTRRGGAPDAVARAVQHALTAKRPRTRYRVGRDARLVPILRLLPDRVRDRLIVAHLARIGSW
jgi:NAD(P)-dependent dehydrogenase (short-subunit alcohol dehydrogenase family)